jgi:hypothetical protein
MDGGRMAASTCNCVGAGISWVLSARPRLRAEGKNVYAAPISACALTVSPPRCEEHV